MNITRIEAIRARRRDREMVAALLQSDAPRPIFFNVSEPRTTLRDEFAMRAMQAMVTKSDGQSKTGGAAGVPLIAQFAYEFADAMLKARSA